MRKLKLCSGGRVLLIGSWYFEKRAGGEEGEAKQDVTWLGVQESLMDVNNPPMEEIQ